jgi:predicted DNA-binding ribbon-helix-helix protein
MIQDRTEGGKFAPKSEDYRHVRSVRLTDVTWEKLGFAAEKRRITRADLIEQMVDDGVFDAEAIDDRSEKTNLLSKMNDAIREILEDPSVTRGGKDRGAARRALEALVNRFH